MSCAIKRLAKEYQTFRNPLNRVCEIHAAPLENNIFVWHFTIKGPNNDELGYANGLYHGALVFPSTYPFTPPDIIFFTPSGRFEVHTKICSTISSYHPERWQPKIDVNSILIALRTFMEQENEIGNGGINPSNYSRHDKREMARKSRSYVCKECGCSMEQIWEKEMCMYANITTEKETSVQEVSSPPFRVHMSASSMEVEPNIEGTALETDGLCSSGENAQNRSAENFSHGEKGLSEPSSSDDNPTEDIKNNSEDFAHYLSTCDTCGRETRNGTNPTDSRFNFIDMEEAPYPFNNRANQFLQTAFRDSSAIEKSISRACEVSSRSRLTQEGQKVRAATAKASMGSVSDNVNCGLKGALALTKVQLFAEDDSNTGLVDSSGNHRCNRSRVHDKDTVLDVGKSIVGEVSSLEYSPPSSVLRAAGAVQEATFNKGLCNNETKAIVNPPEIHEFDEQCRIDSVVESLEQRPMLVMEIAGWRVKVPIAFLDEIIKVCALVGTFFWLRRLFILLFNRYFVTNIPDPLSWNWWWRR